MNKTIERMRRIRLGKLPPTPIHTNSKSGKSASVFVPFCHHRLTGKPSILFTRRSFKLSKHKGEICFPGGFEESTDRDVVHSAVRETIEEIGIAKEDITVYGALNPIPFNTFPLYPVLGYVNLQTADLKLNADEVDSVHVIALEEIALKSNWYRTKFSHGWTTPVFLDAERRHPRIWGMTASILYLTMSNLVPEIFEFDFEYLWRSRK